MCEFQALANDSMTASNCGAEHIPVGFKHTEVGIIPESWTVKSLRSCLSATPDYGINAPAIPFDDGMPTYLRITDIGEDHRYHPSPSVSVDHPDVDSFFLDEGDIVFARTGASVGKSYLYNTDDGPLVFAGFLVRAKPEPLMLDSEYFSYIVQSERYWNWVAQTSARTGQPGINGREYGSFRFPRPSIEEQRAIAEAISDMDGLLESLDALIAKKQAIKQAAMQELLTGQTRLMDFNAPSVARPLYEEGETDSVGTPNTTQAHFWESGMPWCTDPDWRQTTIGELEKRGDVALFRGKVISQKDINEIPGNYPIYSSSVQSSGLFGHYGEYMFDEELITWSVDGGGHFFYRPKHRFSATNVCGYLRIRTKQIDYRFLAFQLQLIHSRLTFDYTSKAHPSIIRGAYTVSLPQISEQRAIATVLSDMDAEILALEARRDKARDLKRGMMQQLLTGRVRLI